MSANDTDDGDSDDDEEERRRRRRRRFALLVWWCSVILPSRLLTWMCWLVYAPATIGGVPPHSDERDVSGLWK